jgi:hypothetical protein
MLAREIFTIMQRTSMQGSFSFFRLVVAMASERRAVKLIETRVKDML